MKEYGIVAADAREKAIYRLEAMALKAERKSDLERAQELRRRAEVLRSEA